MKSFIPVFLFVSTLVVAFPGFVRDQSIPDQLQCLLSPLSPLYIDCLHTYSTIPAANETIHISNDAVCTDPANEKIFLQDWTLGTAGSCKVVSFHSKGDAHCVPPALVREAMENFFTHCVTSIATRDEDGWDGKELKVTQGRWYIDGTTYGRKKEGSKAWIEIAKIRP